MIQMPDILTAPTETAPYETGQRGETGRARVVLRPRDTGEAASAMIDCIASGLHGVPQGANTGLVAGSIPDNAGGQAVISTDRMRGTCEIDPIERTATVSAGIRLSEVNAAAALHGLYLPIDLGADPMIGGMIATNTGGARFLRHGDMRRRVLGLTVVLPNAAGTTLRLGGLRKDNTGPDWKQVFVGTGGAFGLVTEATLELSLPPRDAAACLLVPASAEAVPRLLVALERAFGDELAAFEMMSGSAMRAAFAHVPTLRNPFPAGLPQIVLLVEVARNAAPVDDRRSLDATLPETLANLWEAEPDLLEDAMFGRSEGLWALRHALSEGVRAAGRLFAFDLGFKRRAVLPFRDAMRDSLAAFDPELEICDFGHVGDGGLHLNLVLPRDAARPGDYEDHLRDLVIEAAIAHGGSFSAEHGLGRKHQRYYDRYANPHAMLMAEGLTHALGLAPFGAVRLGTPHSP